MSNFFMILPLTGKQIDANLRIWLVTNIESLQIYESVLLFGHAEFVSASDFENPKQIPVDLVLGSC